MKHPRLDVLKYRAMPEVASALRSGKDDILGAWRAKVVDVLPSADELTLQQLQNSLPHLLEQIADALESSNAQETNELIRSSPVHGTTRFHQHFNLNELLIEYHLLRGTIFETLCATLGRDLEKFEIIGINSGIDIALRRAAVAFADHQATELKTEANSLTKYLSFLSHDIRGGLNGVLLMVEVLKRELVKEERLAASLDDLDMMRRSMLETVSTMDRFLNAERLRRGKMPVKLAAVNLQALLQETARGIAYQAKEKSLEIAINAPGDCQVVSDRELLTLILQNVVGNAVKYSQRGKVILSAGASKGASCGWVEIADEGPGIAQDRLATMFSPFTRGETHGQAGVGLGLTIARQAADLLGAELSAKSKVGEGTTFRLELPSGTATSTRA